MKANRLGWTLAAVVAIAALVAGLWFFHPWSSRQYEPAKPETPVAASGPVEPTFVGSGQCQQCHAPEYRLWHGSDHELAMQKATPDTVLGDFADRTFVYNKITTTFFRRGDQFYVNTDGADGKLHDYRIAYTFGVHPLQQYLIAMPDGRMQALAIAWDARPKAQGGQRWYHLYPGQAIDYRSPLHWTGRELNWNYMCAECHSTHLQKNYDFATNTFHTQWSEINVACEACHGPGSEHVKRAHAQRWQGGDGLVVHFPKRPHWTIDTSTGNARPDKPLASRAEVGTCAVCHSRRSQITPSYRPGEPLLASHMLSLLMPPLYEDDGTIHDEVYNYGSFLQSKMYAKGVTCSNCHDPHSLKLRLPGSGVCLQCHEASKYAVPSHHHHPGIRAATGCPACHMPQRTYMGVDVRYDHSFRVPRPDLSVQYGTPNACNDCHRDKSAKWAAGAVEKWFGPERLGLQHFAPALHAARMQQADAPQLLQQLALDTGQPGIGRATASAELADYLTSEIAQALLPNLHDKDGLVRIGAVRALANAPLQQRWQWLSPLLDDPLRAVRIEVVSQLAAMPEDQMTPAQQKAFKRALAEYIAEEKFNADRPESHVNLGLLYAQRGDATAAENAYRDALRLDPGDVRASVNLADLYRQLGRDRDGEPLLRTALAMHPDVAALHHALAMLLVRTQRLPEALKELDKAAQLDPQQALYGYLYAVALHDSGEPRRALKVLKETLHRHPTDRNTLTALISYLREQGEVQQAAAYQVQLEKLTGE